MSPRRNWDSPTPLSRQRLWPPFGSRGSVHAPPPFGSGGRGTLTCGWGVGGVPIPTTGFYRIYTWQRCGGKPWTGLLSNEGKPSRFRIIVLVLNVDKEFTTHHSQVLRSPEVQGKLILLKWRIHHPILWSIKKKIWSNLILMANLWFVSSIGVTFKK